MKYWDDRYQHHLAKQAPAAASSGAATAAPPAATPAAAASSSKKISKKRDRSPSKGEDSSASLSAAATSDDITAEWYYSYADLQHILLPAFEGIDRSGSVLDIGCGVSNFFDDLRKPLSTAQPKSTKAKKGKQEDATEEISGGAGFTGDFIGLDYSPTVIAHLRQQTPETAANKLHWVCGDACHLLPEAEEQDAAASQSSRKKGKKSSSASPSSSSSSAPPPLSPSVRALFRPESFALILDKATSDGMLCSDHTARLTPLIYAK